MNFGFRLCCFAFLSIAVSVCNGAPPAGSTTESLWPDLPPGTTLRGEGDVPQLIVTRVESDSPTAAVVILPGGGYGGHAMDHEGYQFAEWFKSLGVSSAICTYRLRGKGNAGKGYGHPAPMMDAQRAIQTLRARAQEWNIDPQRIGVIGFSSRPDFSILCYPVIAFGKPYTHKGSQRNLIGAEPDAALLESLSNEKQVTENTPPTFLFHTGADTAVPVQNSLDYYLACVRHGVAAELHVFPEGRHGLGLAQQLPGAKQWPDLCADWLRRLGVVTTK